MSKYAIGEISLIFNQLLQKWVSWLVVTRFLCICIVGE